MYSGTCELTGLIPCELELCNFGYARHRCPAFPADAAADAVRWTFSKDGIRHVVERSYSPVDHVAVSPCVSHAQAEAFAAHVRLWQSMDSRIPK